jgi:hypothetical protein
MGKARIFVLASLLAGTATTLPASATLIVHQVPGGTGVNVVSAACNNTVNGPANTIDGCLQIHHDYDVRFTSTSMIEFGAGGQAKIDGQSGNFHDLMIDIIGHTFSTLILNIEAADNGSVVFSDNLGDTSGSFSVGKNGQNFFKITGDNFQWVKFDSTVDIVTDVKQVRFDKLDQGSSGGGNPPPPPVPEPASLSLLAIALAGIGFVRRRKSQ